MADSRRVFGETQCHHRAEDGSPDCTLERLRSANLCQAHEAVWQIAARERRNERIRTGTPAPNAKRAVVEQTTLDSLLEE
jgi:hypothetical protein